MDSAATITTTRGLITAAEILTALLEDGPSFDVLKKNRRPLTPEEREQVMNAGAVWHHGPNGEETPAVMKSIVNGKTWFSCHTHRCGLVKPTLKGAIKDFDFVKTTA